MIVVDVKDLIALIVGGLAVGFLLVEWVITRIKIIAKEKRYKRYRNSLVTAEDIAYVDTDMVATKELIDSHTKNLNREKAKLNSLYGVNYMKGGKNESK